MKLVLLCYFYFYLMICLSEESTELPPDTGYETIPRDYNYPLRSSHHYTWLPVIIFSSKNGANKTAEHLQHVGEKLKKVREKFKHLRRRKWRRRGSRGEEEAEEAEEAGDGRTEEEIVEEKQGRTEEEKAEEEQGRTEEERAEEEQGRTEEEEEEEGRLEGEKGKNRKSQASSSKSNVPPAVPAKAVAFLRNWLKSPQPLEKLLSNDTWKHKVD